MYKMNKRTYSQLWPWLST